MRKLCLKVLQKLLRKPYSEYSNAYVELTGQDANDYILNAIHNSESGLMVSKWGTIELGTVCTLLRKELNIPIMDILRGKVPIDEQAQLNWLIKNSGFFPNDIEQARRFCYMALQDSSQIDILGSYLQREYYIKKYIDKAVKVDLEGYYAPFLWDKPWTMELKGKKVLVVHPFAESIKSQYKKREKLFENPDVLPEFQSLTVIQAVQSIAGNGENTGFKDWFEALDYMKQQMDKSDYDVALIGCGAYGMSLAAHAKRKGKIAIHLAGWTQMLFGIYGKRWLEDQPKYARFVNEYWIKPSANERPKGAEKVENACYW